MKPEDFVPDGSMETSRITIIEVIDPEGVERVSFVALDSTGRALSRVKFLGMMMTVMLDGYYDEEEEIE